MSHGRGSVTEQKPRVSKRLFCSITNRSLTVAAL